jgi:hypothetical protein
MQIRSSECLEKIVTQDGFEEVAGRAAILTVLI